MAQNHVSCNASYLFGPSENWYWTYSGTSSSSLVLHDLSIAQILSEKLNKMFLPKELECKMTNWSVIDRIEPLTNA